jgi:hypothetical protein
MKLFEAPSPIALVKQMDAAVHILRHDWSAKISIDQLHQSRIQFSDSELCRRERQVPTGSEPGQSEPFAAASAIQAMDCSRR